MCAIQPIYSVITQLKARPTAILDKKYHGLRKEEDCSLPAAWMGLDLKISAHVVLIWKAAGLKLDEAHGSPISDDMEELFVKPEGAEDNDRIVVVKEEKEEEGKLRQPEPETTVEQREVTRGMSVEVPAKEWGWNWAKRTYGPEWKSKTRKDAVEGECDPIRKGKKL
eukprot:g77801.t1